MERAECGRKLETNERTLRMHRETCWTQEIYSSRADGDHAAITAHVTPTQLLQPLFTDHFMHTVSCVKQTMAGRHYPEGAGCQGVGILGR